MKASNIIHGCTENLFNNLWKVAITHPVVQQLVKILFIIYEKMGLIASNITCLLDWWFDTSDWSKKDVSSLQKVLLHNPENFLHQKPFLLLFEVTE